VEGSFDARESGAGPGVAAQVKRILVSFGLVLVLEAIRAVRTGILLFRFVKTESVSIDQLSQLVRTMVVHTEAHQLNQTS
jgi:hypothetical protein